MKNDFKIVKSFRGLDWLKNGTNKAGAQNMVVASAPDGNIILTSNNKWHNRIYTDIEPIKVLDVCKYDINSCELIRSDNHKIYFDVDAKASEIEDKNTYKQSIIDAINLIFPDSDMAISGSENVYKYSYHITLNNYVCGSLKDKTLPKGIVKFLKSKIGAFDDVVYKNNQQMKCIGQSKFNDKS